MTSGSSLRIGTRDSALALYQTKEVQGLLNRLNVQSEIVEITSDGDQDLSTPLYEMGVQGIFTRSLDIALLTGKIDIAVHSMKDVPTQLPKGIVQAAVLESGADSGRVEMRYATVDGRWRWMSVLAHVIRDDQGRVIGAVEALRDVQSEVEAREALVAQAERLEMVLEGSGLGMSDWDMQTGEAVVDERWAGILGYSLAELRAVSSDTWARMTHPDTANLRSRTGSSTSPAAWTMTSGR